MRVGKIVNYNKEDGRGALVDTVYNYKGYKFVNKGYQAGQYVIYDTEHLNPITGYRECIILAPKLWEGYTEKDVNKFIKKNQSLLDDLTDK